MEEQKGSEKVNQKIKMKKIIFLFTILLLSCNNDKDSNYIPTKRMKYFKIKSTGLCYSYEVNALRTEACVPCDSLKNVEVKMYK